MTEDDKMYQLVCKGRFDDLSTDIKRVLTILEGKNGGKGLCEQVRLNTRFNKILTAVAVFLCSVFIYQAAAWLQDRYLNNEPQEQQEQRQVDSKPD